MRITARSIGFLLVALGAWGAIVPFVGPEFGYPFPAGSDVSSWEWSETAWQLSLLPGIATAYGGLVLLGLLGSVRIAPAFGALVALAGGAWFVLGSEFTRLWTTPPPDGTGSDWMIIATNLGYHEGLGVTIVALSAFALGLLALLPERKRTAEQPLIAQHPVLVHEPERTYDEDETVVTTR
ncbi:MAG TPA: hypothetical protein VHH91_01635 [Vicinamibacterales bacterium]|jgi:hypothetical protein|nr:hypothetical protein [Vicinamibacterales bacterium]